MPYRSPCSGSRKGPGSIRCLPFLFLLVLLALSGEREAGAAESLTTLAENLAHTATQRETLESVLAEPTPEIRSLVKSLREGALYRWDGQLWILTDDGVFENLEGKALLDEDGEAFFPEDGLDQVPLPQTSSRLVQQILEAIDLVSGGPNARKAIAIRLGNRDDPSALPVLEAALGRERDPEVREVVGESITRIELSSPDANVRASAASRLGKAKAEGTLSRLRELATKDESPEVRAAGESAVATIEDHIFWRNLVSYFFNGLSLTSVLLIMSLGLAITFGLMGVINMAHGEMLMLGSYTAYVMQEIFRAYAPEHQGFYFLVALPLSILVVGAFGFALERGLLRFLYGRPLESLLATWGVGMVLQQGARLVFGDQTAVSPPAIFRGGYELMRGLVLPYGRLFIIALSLACVVGVILLLTRSNAGLRIRAVTQNRDMAAAIGIRTKRVDSFTFALGTALAGVAGCALALIGTVDPEVGRTYVVDSFMVVVLGGVGKLIGTVLAAFGIGMSNKLLEPLIGGTASAVYAKVAILAIVILVLQRRPTGLFPARGRVSEALARP